MARVGVAGLDTSHADAFASVLDDRDDVELTTVWDSGRIRDDDYVREYCDRYDAMRCDTPEVMVDDVDGVMILTVDWDTHCELALPFLNSGVATLVDKPIAGCTDDVDIIEDAANGTAFFGGSAVPYHPAFDSLPAGVDNQAIYCAGYDDPFYYGCHLVDAVRHLAAADWRHVRPATDPGLAVDVVFENDTFATIRLDGPDAASTFAFLSVAGEVTTTVVKSGTEERQTMYQQYVDTFVDVIEGRVKMNDVIFDAARLLIAVHTALAEQQTVTPDGGKIDDTHIPGTPFVESYDPYY